MKKYGTIYKKLLVLNALMLIAYRGNFVNSIVSSIVYGIFSIVSIVLLTSGTTRIFGWSRNEIILITTSYSIIIGFFHMIFSRNFERFSRIVNLGQLDAVLLKPIDAQFLVSFWVFNYTSIVRILIGVGATGYLLKSMHQTVGLIEIVSFIVLAVIGISILYSIWFICVTFTIWFTRLSNLIDFLYQITGFARFPQEMYRHASSYIFFFLIPLTIVVVTPTKALLYKILSGDVWWAIALSCLLMVAARQFWLFALRHYTSASS